MASLPDPPSPTKFGVQWPSEYGVWLCCCVGPFWPHFSPMVLLVPSLPFPPSLFAVSAPVGGRETKMKFNPSPRLRKRAPIGIEEAGREEEAEEKEGRRACRIVERRNSGRGKGERTIANRTFWGGHLTIRPPRHVCCPPLSFSFGALTAAMPPFPLGQIEHFHSKIPLLYVGGCPPLPLLPPATPYSDFPTLPTNPCPLSPSPSTLILPYSPPLTLPD